MTFHNYDAHSSSIYKTLKSLKLQDMCHLQLAKLIQRLMPAICNSLFQRSSDIRNYCTIQDIRVNKIFLFLFSSTILVKIQYLKKEH